MSNYRKLFSLVSLTLGLIVLLASPAVADQEVIHSFASHAEVHEDASVTVTETITVRATGDEIERGIYRDIPTRTRNIYGLQHTTPLEIQSVSRNGREIDYFTESFPYGIRIYMGREDRYIDPGTYEFELQYTVDRTIGYFEHYDELYWNVTGHEWSFPIQQASFTVSLPEPVSGDAFQLAGYTGYEGATRGDYEITERAAGTVTLETTRTLQPNQGFTAAVGWPRGIVQEPSVLAAWWYFLWDNRAPILGLFLLLGVFLYFFLIWLKVGKGPERGIIIPRYEPPDNLSPAAMRYVKEMGFDDEVFASALVNLAVQGYITLEEDSGTFTAHKQKDPDDNLTESERDIMEELFKTEDRLTFEQDNHETINEARETLHEDLEDGYHRKYFLKNTSYFVVGALLSVVALGAVVALEFYLDQELLFLLGFLAIWTVGVGYILKHTHLEWSRYFRTRGVKHLWSAVKTTLFAVPFLGGEVVVLYLLWSRGGGFLVLLTAVFLLMNVVFYAMLKAPTVQGRELMDEIKGFRRYLRVAEKDELDLKEPPERTAELYEKFLPYAIALGVGNEWARSMTDVIQPAAETRHRPRWYRGTRSGRSLTEFPTNLSDSLASNVSTASVDPSSSSGSSGGGVGGGGGGGGGGGF